MPKEVFILLVLILDSCVLHEIPVFINPLLHIPTSCKGAEKANFLDEIVPSTYFNIHY